MKVKLSTYLVPGAADALYRLEMFRYSGKKRGSRSLFIEEAIDYVANGEYSMSHVLSFSDLPKTKSCTFLVSVQVYNKLRALCSLYEKPISQSDMISFVLLMYADKVIKD